MSFEGGLLWALLGVCTITLFGVGVNNELDKRLEAACEYAQLDFIGNTKCYEDPSCMVTGEDYRSQSHTVHFLKESCPNERKASQVPTSRIEPKETDRGIDLGSVFAGR